MSERRTVRQALTDAEVNALARRLMSRIAWDWRDHLLWEEDVPRLSGDEWVRLVVALDDEASALTARSTDADRVECIDSIYLWEQTQ